MRMNEVVEPPPRARSFQTRAGTGVATEAAQWVIRKAVEGIGAKVVILLERVQRARRDRGQPC